MIYFKHGAISILDGLVINQISLCHINLYDKDFWSHFQKVNARIDCSPCPDMPKLTAQKGASPIGLMLICWSCKGKAHDSVPQEIIIAVLEQLIFVKFATHSVGILFQASLQFFTGITKWTALDKVFPENASNLWACTIFIYLTHQIPETLLQYQQARKPWSCASSKLRPTDRVTNVKSY